MSPVESWADVPRLHNTPRPRRMDTTNKRQTQIIFIAMASKLIKSEVREAINSKFFPASIPMLRAAHRTPQGAPDRIHGLFQNANVRVMQAKRVLDGLAHALHMGEDASGKRNR